MAIVRSPGDFCGAETIGARCKCTAVVIIDTTKTDMSGKQSIWNRVKHMTSNMFSIDRWAQRFLVSHWEKIDHGNIGLCEVHKRRIEYANPALWAALAVAAVTVAVVGKKAYDYGKSYMAKRKIDAMLEKTDTEQSNFITAKEAKEFNEMTEMSHQDKMEYLKSKGVWDQYEKNLAFRNDRLLSSNEAKREWDSFERNLAKATLDKDGLSEADVQTLVESTGNLQLGNRHIEDVVKDSKYAKFDALMREKAKQGFAARDTEQTLADYAKQKQIRWSPLKNKNVHLQDAIDRRDRTIKEIDRAMENEYVTINGKRQYVNASHHAKFTKQPINKFHTQITPEELGHIRETAGVSGTGPLPEHFQTILEDEDTRQAIGKGVVSDLAQRAADRGIMSDADMAGLQHAQTTYGVDADLEELSKVSPAVRIALENRQSYKTMVGSALKDGLLDRSEAHGIETTMLEKGLTKDTMEDVVASDIAWQQGAREMEKVRSHVNKASNDMYLTQEELAGLSDEAKQALVREGHQPYLEATKNTEFMKQRMQHVQKDNAYQASKELFSADMAAERKRYLNEQQDILESTRSNPGFAAAAKEHGVDEGALLKRSQAMRKEAHALKREMVEAGRTRKQQHMYRQTGLVGSAKGSQYAPNTFENRAKFGPRNDLRVDRVLALQNEADALQQCVENNDCSALGLDMEEAQASLSRVTKAANTLREKQVNTWFGDYKHAQGKQTTQDILDETFRHGGQQPSRWERTKETIHNAPGTIASTVVDSGKAAVVYGKNAVVETGDRLKQTARVLDKSIGSPMGITRATVRPQVLPKRNGKVIVAQPKVTPKITPPPVPKPTTIAKPSGKKVVTNFPSETAQTRFGKIKLSPGNRKQVRPNLEPVQISATPTRRPKPFVRLQRNGNKGGFVDVAKYPKKQLVLRLVQYN